jgi:hypothetical protein
MVIDKILRSDDVPGISEAHYQREAYSDRIDIHGAAGGKEENRSRHTDRGGDRPAPAGPIAPDQPGESAGCDRGTSDGNYGADRNPGSIHCRKEGELRGNETPRGRAYVPKRHSPAA